MKTKRICLFISDELLKQLDESAAANYSNRSTYLRECIVLRLRGHANLDQEQAEFLERLKELEQTV